MKYYGDIPVEHLEAIEELQYIEALADRELKDFPVLQLAKGFVDLSLDYYEREFEEEGDRLLLKVEKLCPGYFMAPIFIHMKKDYEFAMIVEQLKDTLGYSLMKKLGFNE